VFSSQREISLKRNWLQVQRKKRIFKKKPGLEVIISIKPAPERKPRNSRLCSGVEMMPGAVPNP
jgi:hypothetical protein